MAAHLLLLLWTLVAAAQAPTAPAVAPATPPATEAAPAAPVDPCARPLPELISAVQSLGERAVYNCLIARDDAGAALMDARATAGGGLDRTTRALAVWRMPRLDTRIPDEEARAYNPGDRRLLRDAIQARRGRASPSPEHDRIFKQFDWYKPDPKYTVAKLQPIDKENMALLDRPPPEPKPVVEPAADAVAKATAPAETGPTSACGCSAGARALGLAPLLVLGLALRRRVTSR